MARTEPTRSKVQWKDLAHVERDGRWLDVIWRVGIRRLDYEAVFLSASQSGCIPDSCSCGIKLGFRPEAARALALELVSFAKHVEQRERKQHRRQKGRSPGAEAMR